MHYEFALLDPRPVPAANEANENVFASGPVYGVEVTVPALAARCIANLDPQHSGGDVSRAAIEAALEAELPPDGATLATVRPDLDSVGAMAVLASRAGNCTFPEAARERIRLIAESDKFARGGWPGPKPLPTLDDLERGAEIESRLAAIARAVADFKIPIANRVRWLRFWLHAGWEPGGYREAYLAERKELASAIAEGRIKAEAAAGGRIAVVESAHRAATSMGYSIAPVVVAFNPAFRLGGGEPHPKFTVAQFTPGHVDLKAAAAELAELEPGWGGSPTIVGSPQGVGSTLTIDQVVSIVKKHLA